MQLIINDRLYLEQTQLAHAAPLFQQIDKSRTHLSEFLPWVPSIASEEDMCTYLLKSIQLIENGLEASFNIFLDGKLQGCIGLHHINMPNRSAAIGYWLGKDGVGKGLILQSCIQLMAYGFNNLKLNRIEIKAALSNFRSQAIPEKLGFKKEGILRQAEFLNGKFIDLQLYALLKEEWDTQ